MPGPGIVSSPHSGPASNMQAGLGASTAYISVAGVQNTRSLSNVPKGFAAIWNLNPDYSEDDLRRDLAEIDFAPDTLKSLDEVKGAFGPCFQEEYTAAAIVVSLNGFDLEQGILQDNGERARLAQWKPQTQGHWLDSNIPSEIQEGWIAVLPELWSHWFICAWRTLQFQ